MLRWLKKQDGTLVLQRFEYHDKPRVAGSYAHWTEWVDVPTEVEQSESRVAREVYVAKESYGGADKLWAASIDRRSSDDILFREVLDEP